MKHLFRHLRAKIFAGILVLLPIGITFLVLKFVFNALDSILGPHIPNLTIRLFHWVVDLPGLGIIAFFLLLYLIGLVTTNVLGRRLVHWTDRLVVNIPVVKNVYIASKQLADAFSATRKGAFRQAVFVEFPQKGNYVLGFLTNELRDLERQDMVTVYVPTGFIPPQGFVLFLHREKILPSQMSIEEAVKAIMSVGMVIPDTLPASIFGTRVKSPSEKDPFAKSREMEYVNPKSEGGF